MRSRDALAGTARVLAFALIYYIGLSYNAAVLLPLLVAVPTIVTAIRRRRQPASGDWKSAVNTAAFWAVLAVATAPAIPRVQLSDGAYRVALALHLVPAMVLMLMAARRRFVPGRFRQITTAAGSLFLVLQLARVSLGVLTPDAVVLDAPFSGEWVVLNGGPSVLLNQHFSSDSQRHAVDLVRAEGGARSAGPPDRLGSYHCFGSEIYAPVDGEVAFALDALPDQAIGTTNRVAPAGNHVVIGMPDGRFVLLAHLQARSVAVAAGDRVAAGDLVGRCGNSGNTTEPHLHIQVQTEPMLNAGGQRTFPIQFTPGQALHRNTAVAGSR